MCRWTNRIPADASLRSRCPRWRARGSHVLSEVGRLIQQSIRISAVSARYGGEEFVNCLSETDTPGAERAAERIRSAIEAFPFKLDENTIQVKISIGIAIAPEHGKDLKSLVAAADRALYCAKETGRNRVCVAEDSDSAE